MRDLVRARATALVEAAGLQARAVKIHGAFDEVGLLGIQRVLTQARDCSDFYVES